MTNQNTPEQQLVSWAEYYELKRRVDYMEEKLKIIAKKVGVEFDPPTS